MKEATLAEACRVRLPFLYSGGFNVLRHFHLSDSLIDIYGR